MSQFRKTGDFYASQWNGNDLNAGTDPTLPKASIASFASSNTIRIVLGSGVYIGGWSGQRWLQGDGSVKINGGGANNSDNNKFQGIHLSNFSFLMRSTQSFNGAQDCILENITNISLRSGADIDGKLALSRNLYIGTDMTSTFRGALYSSLILCSILGTGVAGTRGMSYSYLDKLKTIRLVNITGEWIFEESVVNGKIISNVDGLTYESKKLIDGSPRPDADSGILDIVSIYPSFYINGCYSCDPSEVKIIDLFSRTVEASSILLSKSNSLGFIGGVKVGKSIAVDESGFVITKTGIDDSNPNSWKLSGSFGKVRISGKVSDSLISAQTLDIRIPFNFDGSEVGGSAGNNNVPDAYNTRTTLDTKGLLPNRLTFEVRSSQLANADRNNSADWDNDNTNNPSIAGQYYLMEYGQAMLFHVVSSVSYGNADANAIDTLVKQPFNYRSLDIIITITDTREI
jgi:hypothetical protein